MSLEIILEYSIAEHFFQFATHTELFVLCLINRLFYRSFHQRWKRLTKWQRFDSVLAFWNSLHPFHTEGVNLVITENRDYYGHFDFLIAINGNKWYVFIQSLTHHRCLLVDETSHSFFTMRFHTVLKSELCLNKRIQEQQKLPFQFCLIQMSNCTVVIEYSNLWNIRMLTHIKELSARESINLFLEKFYNSRNGIPTLPLESTWKHTKRNQIVSIANKFRYEVHSNNSMAVFEQYEGLRLIKSYEFTFNDVDKTRDTCGIGLIQDRYILKMFNELIQVFEMRRNNIQKTWEQKCNELYRFDLSTCYLLKCGLLIVIQENIISQNDLILTIFDICRMRRSQIKLEEKCDKYYRECASWTTNQNKSTLFCLLKDRSIETFDL